MQSPQPQQLVTRRYLQDAHYNADAERLAASGWRVVSLQREPTGAIVATYAPLAPVAPAARSWRHALTIGGAALGLLLVVSIVFTLITLARAPRAPGAATTTATTATAYAATIQAMSQPQGTLPPTALAPVTGAHLGGPIGDFDTAFGVPQTQYQWPATTIAAHTVAITITPTNLGDSRDDQDRAVLIDITGQSVGQPWSAAADATIVASFLPTDAIATRDAPATSQLGPDHIFTSAQLAASLAPAVFQSAAGQQLAPGVFDWQCSTQQPYCEIGVGSNS